MTANDIITAALLELNVYSSTDTIQASDTTFVLGKLNDLLDEWAARRVYIYDVSFPTFTLVSGLSPHTIGPMGLITQTSLTSNTAAYTCINNFTVGQLVTVQNCTNGAGVFNVTNQPVVAATATSFQISITSGNVSQANDSGQVVLATSPFATFATPNLGQRPQRIESATLILTNQTPNTEVPINIRDENWWMNQRVKGLESTIPIDLYYDPNFPNGSLYFWPVPDYAYGVRLKLWGTIPQFPSTTYNFSLPPGYQKAIKLSLARDIAGSFGAIWTAQQESNWQRAIKAIEANNDQSPRGRTGDAGMPGIGTRGGFNYVSSLPS